VSAVRIQAQETGAVERAILDVRGRTVMLDADLARLYGATTKRLNEQVKRTLDRFPPNFVFPLARTEFRNLKCQFGTSSWGGGATSILGILRPHLPSSPSAVAGNWRASMNCPRVDS